MMHADHPQDYHGNRDAGTASAQVDVAEEPKPRGANMSDTEFSDNAPAEYVCVDRHARRTFDRWQQAGQANSGELAKNTIDDQPTGPERF